MSEAEKTPEPTTVANSGTGGRPGIKTTEFWVMVAMTILGAWLIERGHDEIGATIIGLAGSGYTGARTWLKHRTSVVDEVKATNTVTAIGKPFNPIEPAKPPRRVS